MKKLILTLMFLMMLSSLVMAAKGNFYSDPNVTDLKFPQIQAYYYPTNVASEYGLIPQVQSYIDYRPVGDASEHYGVRYDMREEGFMPDIRSQSPWGTCWAHAMLGTAEASAMMKYGSYASLSPLHLAWGGKSTDTIIINPLRTGGNWNSTYYKSWVGPVSEKDCPYKEPWVLPKGVKYELPGYVTSTFNVSIPSLKISYEEKEGSGGDGKETEYDYDKYTIDVNSVRDRVEAVKKFVSKHGAMYISYCAGVGTKDATIFVDHPLDYEKGETVNHAVCIVGWDDLYSIDGSAFNTVPLSRWEEIPDPDGKNIVGGAFIIRNSWGQSGDHGYYYMSYLDRSLSSGGYGCEFTAKEDIKYNKAMSIGSFATTASEPGQFIRSARYALATMTASESGIAYAVRIQSGSATTVKCKVINTTTGDSAKAYLNFDYSGYQTADLSTPLKFHAGDVIEVKSDYDEEEDGNPMIAVDLPENPNSAMSNCYLSNDNENWYLVNANVSAELLYSEIISVEEITVNPESLALQVGDGYQLTYNVLPKDASDKSVTWTSSNPSVVSVSSAGFVKALKSGKATITVTSNDVPSIQATCVVNVEIPVKSITLDKTSVFVDSSAKKAFTLKATVKPKNATDPTLVWKSSNTKVATVKNGVVTPKGVGSAVITVSSKSNSSVKATCAVTVGVQLKSIKITSAPTTLTVGTTGSIKIAFNPTNATNKKVTWKSSNTSIATVSGNGVVTAVKSGTVKITVTSAENSSIKATCTIYVANPVKKIVLNSVKYTGKVGGSYKLKAKVYPDTAGDKDVVWKSSSPKYVSIDANGNMKFLKSTKAVTITCSSASNSKVKATCKVTVN